MRGGHRVAWLHHSPVYHRHTGATWRPWVGHGMTSERLLAPCGVVLTTPLYQHKEGTEVRALRFGLRPCKRCFTAPYQPPPH